MEKTKNSYKKSGVNIALANSFVKHIAKISKKNVRKKNNTGNSNNIGAFGSLFDISKINIKGCKVKNKIYLDIVLII